MLPSIHISFQLSAASHWAIGAHIRPHLTQTIYKHPPSGSFPVACSSTGALLAQRNPSFLQNQLAVTKTRRKICRLPKSAGIFSIQMTVDREDPTRRLWAERETISDRHCCHNAVKRRHSYLLIEVENEYISYYCNYIVRATIHTTTTEVARCRTDRLGGASLLTATERFRFFSAMIERETVQVTNYF